MFYLIMSPLKDTNHLKYKPNSDKLVHTVFNVDKSNVIGLVDEAWTKKGVGALAGNGYVTNDIDMGKVIGTNGESSI